MAGAHSFGRYRVTGTLGAGGMGEVYAAVDDVLGREVAVKTLRGHHDGLAARMLDERFRQEARAIAQLSHPGIVQVFDLDLAAEPPYLVMERVAGPSLKERIASGPLELAELRAFGIQIARALAAAHAAGIVHRDVKPANILAASGGMWKLADFGVAHVPDSSLTLTGQFVGSPAYAPPEALIRGEVGAAGDVFGLGATLYEAALGRWPRAEATTGGLLAAVPPLGQLAPHLPADLAAAIDRAVALEPDARPSAAALAEVLARAPSDSGIALAGAAQALPIAAPWQTAAHGSSSASLPGAAPAMSSASLPGAAHAVSMVGPARPAMPLRWKPLAAGALGLLAVIVIVAIAARGSSSSTPLAPSEAPTEAPPPPPETPGELRAVTPPAAMSDRRAGKDWRKVVDKLRKGDYREALHKLEEFERKHGASDETSSLRTQLEQLPDDHRRRDDD